MAEYLIQDTTLINIANAIRAKEGTTESISPNDFADRINVIQTGPKLESIEIVKQPTKVSYTAFEPFSTDGMEVKAIFSNGANKFITDFEVEPSVLHPSDTLVKIKHTEFGVTVETDVPVTVVPINLSVPTVNETLVYTGSALTPTWTGYDDSVMTISGELSGTNAGSYTAIFSLKDKVNCTWADGTTADKSVTWSIGKAQASITLDKTNVVLNGDKLSETVTFSSVGMTSVIAMSSDPSIASITMNGNVITISSVDETTGTANIIISGEVDSNYNAPEYPSIAVSAEFVKMVKVTIDDWSNDSYWFMSVSVFDTETGKFVYDDWGTGATVQVSSGYISVKISSDNRHTEDTRASIYVNGVEVEGSKLREGESVDYEHTLTKNTIVKCVYEDDSYEFPCPRIYITEIPEGHALVNITAVSAGATTCYVSIDGVMYTASATVVVPVGTTIYCMARSNDGENSNYYGTISVNGSGVASADKYMSGKNDYWYAEYNYTVKGDVIISLYYSSPGADITITEQ